MKAPVGRRIVAWAFDMAVDAVAAGLIVGGGYFLYSTSKSAFGILAGLFSILCGALFFAAYVLLRDGFFRGRGLGKRVVGLRVVSGDGSPCGFVSSALRNVTMLVPGVNVLELVLAVVDVHGRRLGDKVARTQVIE